MRCVLNIGNAVKSSFSLVHAGKGGTFCFGNGHDELESTERTC